MERAYRYRFYPTPEQESLLRRTLGCVRLVFNRALAARTEAWYLRQERIDYQASSALLTHWKKQDDLTFLNEVSSVPLQQGLRHLQKAFSHFWAGRAQYPNFRKKRNGGSAEFTRSAFRWKDGKLFLAKCDQALPIVWSRSLPAGAEPSTVTVKLDPSGRWHVSLLVDEDINPLASVAPVGAAKATALPRSSGEALRATGVDKAIGLDAGITALVTTSDGEKVSNPRHFNRQYNRLRKAQKALSRKQKASRTPVGATGGNRDKARLKVARVQAKIADCRKDFLHKLTTRIVRENQTVVVEDLSVKNMVQNRKLSRAISDAGWGEMVRQLTYKCQWYGRTLVKIDRWFPSTKRCGHCGQIVSKLPLSMREWRCPACQTLHDRDINAARNILAAGLAVTACGANVRPEEHRLGRQLH